MQHSEGVCGDSNTLFDGQCFNYTQEQLAQFPTITLHVQGETAHQVDLIMSPDQYIVLQPDGSYCYGIKDTGPFGLSIIGDTTLQRYYSMCHSLPLRVRTRSPHALALLPLPVCAFSDVLYCYLKKKILSNLCTCERERERERVCVCVCTSNRSLFPLPVAIFDNIKRRVGWAPVVMENCVTSLTLQ
jgi:hypothetical protein